MKRVAIVGCVVLVSAAACAPTAPKPPATPSGSASTEATVPVATPVRGEPSNLSASEVFRSHWPQDWTGGALYIDMERLARTELVRTLTPRILDVLSGGKFTKQQTACFEGALMGAREIAVAIDKDGSLVLARFAPESMKESPRECVQAMTEGKAAPPDGAQEAWTIGDTIVVLKPGLLVIGPRALVTSALDGARRNKPATLPAGLALAKDRLVAIDLPFSEERGYAARATLEATSEHVRIDAVLTAKDEQAARALEGTFKEGVDSFAKLARKPEPNGPAMQRLHQAFQMKRDGGRISLTFDLREPAVDQVRDFMAATSVGIAQYVTNSKIAEAKNALTFIAKYYVEWWETERENGLDGKPKPRPKLISFPAVPKTVPRGTSHQTSAADWKPWAPIHFEMAAPQRFQYEVRAAKNGESAEVIARGDLDGNGKTSLFRIKLEIDRKANRMVVAPGIEEQDPDE